MHPSRSVASRRSPRHFSTAAVARRSGRKIARRSLQFEPLEVRAMLAIDLAGVPDWFELGSRPMISAGSVSDPNNPASGAVEDIAIDPANVAHMFVGSVNGGIWRTTTGNRPFNGIDDDGVNGVDDAGEQPDWFPLTDQFPSLAIGDIRFSPLDPTGNTIFAGTGSASSLSNAGGTPIGVLRSTDGGDTWSVFRLNPAGTEPRVRAVLPTTFDGDAGTPGVQQVVLVGVAANTGLYRSIDGGQTYAAISGGSGLPLGAVTQIIADPNNASQYFAGVVGQGVYRSTDGGANWTAANTNLTNLAGSTLIELAAHPGGGTTVLYTLISGPNPVAFTSNNSGNTWTGLAALPAAFTSTNNGLYTSMAADQLAVDPGNSQIVYVAKGYGGSPFLYRYNPAGGGSWVQIESGGASGNTRPHVDNRDLQFAGNNVLIAANDGGIYFLRNPQNAAANRWTSLHGLGANGLGVTEYHNIAWDSRFDVATGGAQDNGTSVQNAVADPVWTQYQGADGGDVHVDTVNAGAGRSFRYASSQNFGANFTTPFAGGLMRHTFDSATNEPIAAVDLITTAGLTGFNAPFVPLFELDAVDLTRLATGGSGTNPVYELTNAATAPNAAGATWVAVPVGAGFGAANAIAYGGRLGGVDNPEVLVVGSGSGVFIRSTAGGTLTATAAAFPGGTIQDIVLDPENWQHFFVTDGAGVWETTDAGATAGNWRNLTGNLASVNTRLQTIEFVPTPEGGVVVVGGNLGVSRLPLGTPGAPWTRFGAGLPNALTQDLDYNAADDILLAGTFGRGAWRVQNAATLLEQEGVLNICGDEDFVNQDDVIRLVRNAVNPLILDVFLNSVVPVFSTALAALQQINVFGVGGNDTLIVDSTNGLIAVPGGIRYDGDGVCPGELPAFGYDRGFDTLSLTQTGGAPQTSDTLAVGQLPGSGISTIVGTVGGLAATQVVYFEELEPVLDVVPSPSFTITSAPGLASLLQDDNQINYEVGLILGAAAGRVTVDNFEPIEFSNKTALIIDAGAGNDVVNLNNPTTPTGLTSITVNAGDGDDTVTTNSGVAVPVTFNGGAGNDLLDASGAAGATTTLNGDDGDDTLVGSTNNGTADTFGGGAGSDTILIRGTLSADRIDVTQTGVANFTSTVNGSSHVESFTAVEELRIVARDGDDIIRVQPGDLLASNLRFVVDGGVGFDRLAVADAGLGDLLLHRKGASDDSGAITVGPANPSPAIVDFLNVDFINPVTAANGQLLVFKHDPFEFNNDRLNATHLGAARTINVDPTIDPGPDIPFNLPGDQDWYRVEALASGTLDFQVFFRQIGTLASGRPGLPGNGDLDISLFDASGDLVATSLSFNDNERVRVPAVQGQIYFLGVASAADATAVNNYSLTIINEPAPLPYNLELLDNPVGDPPPANSDTGRNNTDNITRDNTPTLVFRLDDAFFLNDLPGNDAPDSPPDQVIPVPFRSGPAQPVLPGYAIAVFDEGPAPFTLPQTPLGFATQTAPGVYTFTTPVLADGSHFLTARVQMIDAATPRQTGFGARSLSLEIVVDTAPPPASFGQPGVPDDGLAPESDTGVSPPNPDTISDNVTTDTTPAFWGRAEADTIVRLYADVNNNGTLEIGTDAYLGQDTAIPLDGNAQEPDGYWEINSIVDLNDPAFFAVPDGLRTIFVTAEDVAGNVNAPAGAADTLRIFIDTRGPVITDVFVTDAPAYDLFDPKPSTDGPTPLVNRLTITFTDPPARVAPDFLYPALKQDVAEQPGHYRLVGDANGVIAIQQVIVTNDPVVPGEAATASVILVFFQPLPDDRFTLTVSDAIMDPVGNHLDGENNAVEPQENPLFPTGDGVPGGTFTGRFTIDSRPEIATWSTGTAYVDTNGNFHFDPTNVDATNRDITYVLGLPSDFIFAGNFAPTAASTADGFDKLAAYGKTGNLWRWLIDTNNDGVPNLVVTEPRAIVGQPVAGEFDGNPNNGDEVGLFTGTVLWVDTNHDFRVDKAFATLVRGYPIVGDFDGDGLDDLGAWQKGVFGFDLAANGFGQRDATIAFNFIGSRLRPVAADMDQDGIDDIGLWVPDRSGTTLQRTGEWFFLISNDPAGVRRVTGQVNTLRHAFKPVPFGRDISARFGEEFAVPLVGNFDPPVTAAAKATAADRAIVRVTGTSGKDVFEVNPGRGTVKINGVVQKFAGSNVAIAIDGAGGFDSVVLVGGAGADQAELWNGRGTLAGPGYRVSLQRVESIRVHGSGGNNTAVLHGSTGADALTANGSITTLAGQGFKLDLRGFTSVSVYSGGARRPAATTKATDAVLSAGGLFNSARAINATSAAPAADLATLYGARVERGQTNRSVGANQAFDRVLRLYDFPEVSAAASASARKSLLRSVDAAFTAYWKPL